MKGLGFLSVAVTLGFFGRVSADYDPSPPGGAPPSLSAEPTCAWQGTTTVFVTVVPVTNVVSTVTLAPPGPFTLPGTGSSQLITQTVWLGPLPSPLSLGPVASVPISTTPFIFVNSNTVGNPTVAYSPVESPYQSNGGTNSGNTGPTYNAAIVYASANQASNAITTPYVSPVSPLDPDWVTAVTVTVCNTLTFLGPNGQSTTSIEDDVIIATVTVPSVMLSANPQGGEVATVITPTFYHTYSFTCSDGSVTTTVVSAVDPVSITVPILETTPWNVPAATTPGGQYSAPEILNTGSPAEPVVTVTQIVVPLPSATSLLGPAVTPTDGPTPYLGASLTPTTNGLFGGPIGAGQNTALPPGNLAEPVVTVTQIVAPPSDTEPVIVFTTSTCEPSPSSGAAQTPAINGLPQGLSGIGQFTTPQLSTDVVGGASGPGAVTTIPSANTLVGYSSVATPTGSENSTTTTFSTLLHTQTVFVGPASPPAQVFSTANVPGVSTTTVFYDPYTIVTSIPSPYSLPASGIGSGPSIVTVTQMGSLLPGTNQVASQPGLNSLTGGQSNAGSSAVNGLGIVGPVSVVTVTQTAQIGNSLTPILGPYGSSVTVPTSPALSDTPLAIPTLIPSFLAPIITVTQTVLPASPSNTAASPATSGTPTAGLPIAYDPFVVPGGPFVSAGLPGTASTNPVGIPSPYQAVSGTVDGSPSISTVTETAPGGTSISTALGLLTSPATSLAEATLPVGTSGASSTCTTSEASIQGNVIASTFTDVVVNGPISETFLFQIHSTVSGFDSATNSAAGTVVTSLLTEVVSNGVDSQTFVFPVVSTAVATGVTNSAAAGLVVTSLFTKIVSNGGGSQTAASQVASTAVATGVTDSAAGTLAAGTVVTSLLTVVESNGVIRQTSGFSTVSTAVATSVTNEAAGTVVTSLLTEIVTNGLSSQTFALPVVSTAVATSVTDVAVGTVVTSLLTEIVTNGVSSQTFALPVVATTVTSVPISRMVRRQAGPLASGSVSWANSSFSGFSTARAPQGTNPVTGTASPSVFTLWPTVVPSSSVSVAQSVLPASTSAPAVALSSSLTLSPLPSQLSSQSVSSSSSVTVPASITLSPDQVSSSLPLISSSASFSPIGEISSSTWTEVTSTSTPKVLEPMAPMCAAGGAVGSWTLDFEGPLGNIFNPYLWWYLSEIFLVTIPGASPFEPYSGQKLALFNSTSDIAEIGVGPRRVETCFRFDWLSMAVGCVSGKQVASCVFDVWGSAWDQSTQTLVSIQYQKFSIPSCPSQQNCPLTVITGSGFEAITSLFVRSRVDGQASEFWVDDIKFGWTDNSCIASECRQGLVTSSNGLEAFGDAIGKRIVQRTPRGRKRMGVYIDGV